MNYLLMQNIENDQSPTSLESLVEQEILHDAWMYHNQIDPEILYDTILPCSDQDQRFEYLYAILFIDLFFFQSQDDILEADNQLSTGLRRPPSINDAPLISPISSRVK